MTTFEKLDSEELTNIELESEAGFFRMKEDEEGNVVVELENKEGKKIVLNDLLPEGWKMVDSRSESRVDTEEKTVLLNSPMIKYDGWQYLLTILHELGHVEADQSDEGREMHEELASLRDSEELLKDSEIMSHFNELHSKLERDAWAYALQEFRKILEGLDMNIGAVFSSREELKDYVHEWLLTYKDEGIEDITNMDADIKDREELTRKLLKLYTHYEQQY